MNVKEYIDQYGQLLGEFKDLEDELLLLCRKTWKKETDAVVGSSVDIPYQKHSITLHGFAQDPKVIKKRDDLAEQYKAKMAKIYEQIGLIESKLDEIEDTKLRRIIRLKCINELTWQQIADKLNGEGLGSNTENSVKQIFSRFMKNFSNVTHVTCQ
jgi:hypothetical protein